jgi:GDPmannose 4,6-dehydratase
MYACNGILFNHESPVRGETFVTRKITRAASKIALGLQNCLYVGNLSAQRDWGHAKDYVEAMWLMLQQETAEDFVIATGVTTTVRDFIRMAFMELGIEVEFSGKDESERGVIIDIDEEKIIELGLNLDALRFGQTVVKVDPQYFRPTEVDLLIGDATKANTKLGWKPKYDLQALVTDMVLSDLHLVKKDEYLKKGGFNTLNYFE